ncbi:MAG: transketolase [Deltaproteobacteria bacterium]|nr:transketolase [Deltaproteobacteria bacterium]MCB9487559.1 transketolase [Deltaproteobacteria bacterium]
MALAAEELKMLQDKAYQIRRRIVQVTERSGGGHLGGSLSQTDILVALYYKYMNINKDDPRWPERDRFVLSKGHGGLGHGVILGDLGYVADEDLDKFGKTGSIFGMHLDRHKVPGVDASTGSLAHGFGIGLGFALGARLKGLPWHTYIVLSDGELHEGTIWEAAMAGAQFNLTNQTTFIDRNRLMIDGFTEDIMKLEPLQDKWAAFGWNVMRIDGHDFNQICQATEDAKKVTDKPTVIICDTVKGKGVEFMEDERKWHYGGLDDAMAKDALASLDEGKKKRDAAEKKAS